MIPSLQRGFHTATPRLVLMTWQAASYTAWPSIDATSSEVNMNDKLGIESESRVTGILESWRLVMGIPRYLLLNGHSGVSDCMSMEDTRGRVEVEARGAGNYR